jgi:hypothetical protein
MHLFAFLAGYHILFSSIAATFFLPFAVSFALFILRFASRLVFATALLARYQNDMIIIAFARLPLPRMPGYYTHNFFIVTMYICITTNLLVLG